MVKLSELVRSESLTCDAHLWREGVWRDMLFRQTLRNVYH
jgi:hypothetical protein